MATDISTDTKNSDRIKTNVYVAGSQTQIQPIQESKKIIWDPLQFYIQESFKTLTSLDNHRDLRNQIHQRNKLLQHRFS